jgi:hypothetical protein
MSITHSPVKVRRESIIPWSTLTWSYDGDISPTDYNELTWAAGNLNFSNDISYAITGSSDTFADTKYLYWDVINSGILQFGTATDCVGNGIVPIGVGIENTDTGELASLRVFQGPGLNITADNIATGTLSAISADIGDITAGTITGLTITGGTIQTAVGPAQQRIVLKGSTNTLELYDSVNASPRVEIDDNAGGGLPGIKLNTTSGTSHAWLTMSQLLVKSTNTYPSLYNFYVEQSRTDDASVYGGFISLSDTSSNTYGNTKYGLWVSANIGNGTNDTIPIGLYVKGGSSNSSIVGLAIETSGHVKIQGNFGSPNSLEVSCATSPQVKITYDGTNSSTLGTDSSGNLNIVPSGLLYLDATTFVDGNVYIPDGNRFCIIDANTQWAIGRNLVSLTTNDIVTNDRFQFTTYTNGNDGFQFGPYTGSTPWFEIQSGGHINFTGAMYQDAAQIISSTGQQTGIFKTRQSYMFNYNGSATDAVTYNAGSAAPGYIPITTAGVITQVGVSVTAIIPDFSTSELDIIVEVTTSATDNTWDTAYTLTLTSSHYGDYVVVETLGTPYAITSEGRMRVRQVEDGSSGGLTLTDPVVIVSMLSE